MPEHDETLEIGLAAGLDVPTALAISERDDEPPPTPAGCLGGVLAVLLIPKIVKFLTKFSDQRERIEDNRAVARIGWRPCRPVFISLVGIVSRFLP